MAGATDLAKMVPGFEFLQSLMKGASSALPGMPGVGAIPGMSQWIAPTLDPEELDKRISELKTVQFWLEQNARLLGTTIQALEVQRMTLSTLQTMNLPMTDLRNALKINLPSGLGKSARQEPHAETESESEEAEPAATPAPTPRKKAAGAPKPAPAAVDPMQWWGALTQQFTELATKAMKDSATDAARGLAGAAVKQTVASAGNALKKAATLPARAAAKTAAQAAGARKRRG